MMGFVDFQEQGVNIACRKCGAPTKIDDFVPGDKFFDECNCWPATVEDHLEVVCTRCGFTEPMRPKDHAQN